MNRIVAAMAAGLYLFACAGNQLTVKDDTELGQEAAELAACGKDQACRDATIAKWHKIYNAQFDGGF